MFIWEEEEGKLSGRCWLACRGRTFLSLGPGRLPEASSESASSCSPSMTSCNRELVLNMLQKGPLGTSHGCLPDPAVADRSKNTPKN